MQKFFEALANIFKIPDLRKRVLFTLAMLAVYRVGAYIPTPGIDWRRFEDFCTREANWLTDYALYAELRRRFKTGAWATWPEEIRRREPKALAKVAAESGRNR